jgi:GNAT superfamily N-acetyltransferase
MSIIRPCRAGDLATVLAVINSAAVAYRGVIPEDCWHEPYMSSEDLRHEMEAGVAFSAYQAADGDIMGVMGIQPVRDVWLIRHAYVLPQWQRHGVGRSLLEHLLGTIGTRQVLVGTWAAADWAINFYRRHGFALVSEDLKTRLLQTYWTIPVRQIETSVVLARDTAGRGVPS